MRSRQLKNLWWFIGAVAAVVQCGGSGSRVSRCSWQSSVDWADSPMSSWALNAQRRDPNSPARTHAMWSENHPGEASFGAARCSAARFFGECWRVRGRWS